MRQFECTINNDNGMRVSLRYEFTDDVEPVTIEEWIKNTLLSSLNKLSLDLDDVPFTITHMISKRFT